MNVLKFNIDDINIVQEVSDQQLAIAEVKVCHSGMNLHEKPISLETLKKATPTLVNKFLVAGFNGIDFKGHEGKSQMIVGFFPKENNFRYIEEDGKTYLVANAIISKIYAEWAFEIFKKENFKECSMEITLLETELKEDGYEWITSFVFNGVTVLGNVHHAACPGSNVEIVKFSTDEMISNGEKVYLKFKNQFKIPNIVKQNAQTGLGLKKNNSKGATAVNITIANQLVNNEFASMDLINNIYKFSEKAKTEVSQLLLGGIECFSWVDEILNIDKFMDKKEEGDKMEDNKIEKIEEEEEKMSSDDNTETTAKIEINEKEAEQNQELTDEKMSDEEKKEEMAKEENEEDFKTKFEELYGKYSELEEKFNIMMAENDNLKKFKVDVEEKEKMAKVEYTLHEVMEAGMPEDKAEEFRTKASEFSIENINIWANEVKAEALSFATKNETKKTHIKIGLPFSTSSSENIENRWDRLKNKIAKY